MEDGSDRRTFWNDPGGIDVPLGREADAADIWNAVEDAAAMAGLGRGKRLRGPSKGVREIMGAQERRSFRPRGGLRALKVTIGWNPCAVLVHPAFDEATDAAEADALAKFVSGVCAVLQPPIARSYGPGVGNGCLEQDEIRGPLRWIDWWQFLGADIVERVGREKIESLGVFEVASATAGALIVRATRSPNEFFARRPLAEYLGIRLKPWRDWHPDSKSWSEREWPF